MVVKKSKQLSFSDPLGAIEAADGRAKCSGKPHAVVFWGAHYSVVSVVQARLNGYAILEVCHPPKSRLEDSFNLALVKSGCRSSGVMA